MLVYLLRVACIYFFALLRKRTSILRQHTISDIVLPTDIDHLLHMNNARYSRHFDYGRADFWVRNGKNYFVT